MEAEFPFPTTTCAVTFSASALAVSLGGVFYFWINVFEHSILTDGPAQFYLTR